MLSIFHEWLRNDVNIVLLLWLVSFLCTYSPRSELDLSNNWAATMEFDYKAYTTSDYDTRPWN